MISYKQFLQEGIISPSKEPNTMSFWHGGNLENSYADSISHKKGRFEYGPGLYLSTHHGTAQKYSKGSRKLYHIVVEKGNDVEAVVLDFNKVKEFVNEFVIKSKRKEVLSRYEKYIVDEKLKTSIFINVILNEDAIKPTNTNEMRKFLVENGVDYWMVSNAFGWNEMMLVLFNMKKIVRKEVVGPKDKIEEYDLPTKFN